MYSGDRSTRSIDYDIQMNTRRFKRKPEFRGIREIAAKLEARAKAKAEATCVRKPAKREPTLSLQDRQSPTPIESDSSGSETEIDLPKKKRARLQDLFSD